MPAVTISQRVDDFPVRYGKTTYEEALADATNLAAIVDYKVYAVVFVRSANASQGFFAAVQTQEAYERGEDYQIVSLVTPEGFVDEWSLGDSEVLEEAERVRAEQQDTYMAELSESMATEIRRGA